MSCEYFFGRDNLVKQKKQSRMTTGKALVGILAGIAAGTVIGIIVAPAKGNRLKKVIARKRDDLADAINERIDEKFEELLQTVSERMKKMKYQAEGKADEPAG